MKLGVIILLCHVCGVNGYRILLFPTGSESDQLIFTGLGQDLVRHGHDVTLLIGDKKVLIPELQVGARGSEL